MGRKKRKNTGPSPNLSDIALNYNIRISNPYGYYPDDVDRIIRKQEELINTLQAETQRLDKLYSDTKEELKIAKAELQRIRFDISVLELPDTSTEEDFAMMSRLSNINENVGTIEHQMPEIAENSEARIPLDVIENTKSSGDIMFDDLVTGNNSNMDNNPRPAENINKNASNIYNEFGQLEIL